MALFIVTPIKWGSRTWHSSTGKTDATTLLITAHFCSKTGPEKPSTSKAIDLVQDFRSKTAVADKLTSSCGTTPFDLPVGIHSTQKVCLFYYLFLPHETRGKGSLLTVKLWMTKDDWNVERPSELFASTHPASQTVLALAAAEAAFCHSLTGEWYDITYKYSIYMKEVYKQIPMDCTGY